MNTFFAVSTQLTMIPASLGTVGPPAMFVPHVPTGPHLPLQLIASEVDIR